MRRCYYGKEEDNALCERHGWGGECNRTSGVDERKESVRGELPESTGIWKVFTRLLYIDERMPVEVAGYHESQSKRSYFNLRINHNDTVIQAVKRLTVPDFC